MSTVVKCLLVDDREENLLALTALLEADDVEVLQARSGPEALELLLVHDVALAFLDVQMPEMDGFELAELMRGSARTRDVPIIFVTAGSRDQHRLFKGYESGAVDFLYKPIDPYILRNKADVFFQLYRQKRQLAEDLRERTETLRLNEMFMAVLGHDLRNPLSAIVTSAAFLQRNADEGVKRAADRIRSSSKRMSQMIEDILDVTRARVGGGIAINRVEANLGELVQRVIAEVEGAHPDRVVELAVTGDLTGRWDTERLAQVASNLVGNALEHGDAKEPIHIRIDGSASHEVRLSVTNAGTIAPEALPHIFDPFQSGRRQPGRSNGLGLGLYIVQQILRSHGGEVTVDAPGGDHTCFTVVVPRGV